MSCEGQGVADDGRLQPRKPVLVAMLAYALAVVVIGVTVFCGYEAGASSHRVSAVVLDKVPVPVEAPVFAMPAVSQFLVAVADDVASPAQRNESLRIDPHQVGFESDFRAAAVGALGANETRGYENELRWIAHFVVPAAGWYAKRKSMRDDMLLGCRGRVYRDDECYAAFLGALIARDVPKGYAAKRVTVMSKYPLRSFLHMLQSINWNVVQS